MKLAVGPLLYCWPKDDVIAFYDRLVDLPVDIVYLGESVCARRREMRAADWATLADRLTEAGKSVVLSTLALIETESDLKIVRNIVDNEARPVEANDYGAVGMLNDAGRSFVAGMHLNIYNATTLHGFARLGCVRWVPPVEMGRDALNTLLRDRPEGVETEVFAYGKMPLAFSARCFTARRHGLNKDDCRFMCKEYPDGLGVLTQESEPFLSLNGTQTQSALPLNLIDFIDEMKQMGVDVVRLSPQSTHFDAVVREFDAARRASASVSAFDWSQVSSTGHCNGYWLGQAGIRQDSNR